MQADTAAPDHWPTGHAAQAHTAPPAAPAAADQDARDAVSASGAGRKSPAAPAPAGTREKPEAVPPSQPPTPAPTRPPAGLRTDYRRWRKLEQLRGISLLGAFAGWMVTVGISSLLTGLLAAGGNAIGLQQGAVANVSGGATELTVGGAILLWGVLTLASWAGGYVAGRLSRFRGALQGLAAWVVGVAVTAGIAVVAALAGAQYNVLQALRLPSIPVQGQALAGGGLATLIAIAATSLVASILGAVVGRRYHSRVDRLIAQTPKGY